MQSHCYAHDPTRAEERRRNASRGGRTRGNGELPDLKKQLKDLTARLELEPDPETVAEYRALMEEAWRRQLEKG